MRKDTHIRYHPQSRSAATSQPSERAPRKHNCMICRHVECDEINRKILDGWRYSDIIRQHPWIRSSHTIPDHATCLGLQKDLEKIREIKLKKILTDIIRAGLPTLDEGKVYPRDIIEAVKALSDLEKKGDVKKLWQMIEYGRNDAPDESPRISPESEIPTHPAR